MERQVQAWSAVCSVSYGDERYLVCHSMLDSAPLLHVTNGIDVWRTDLTEEALEDLSTVLGPLQDSPERLREKFQCSSPLLDILGSSANLTVHKDSSNVTLNLFKLPVSEATAHLQALLFDLSDRVLVLEKRLIEGSASTAISPVKQSHSNQLLCIPDIDSRKKGSGGSVSQVKKRVPGESLINPGCKSKKAAKGVDFDDS
ncbi:protein PAXX [Rhinophrynus dorsalis]